jgi:hypothetical protein
VDRPPPAGSIVTEEYNGSTWTPSNNLNTARAEMGGAGTQTAALSFGGVPGPLLIQEQQKNMMGIVGQVLTSLNTGRSDLVGAGTQTAA